MPAISGLDDSDVIEILVLYFTRCVDETEWSQPSTISIHDQETIAIRMVIKYFFLVESIPQSRNIIKSHPQLGSQIKLGKLCCLPYLLGREI